MFAPLLECEVLAQAEAYIAVPYVRHGESLEGWDCIGCLRIARRALFDRPTPRGGAFYTHQDMDDPERRAALFEVAALAWRPCAKAPGVAVLFNRYGRADHVGLMLTRNQFLHAQDEAAGTVISDLSGAWLRRVAGFYDAG